MERVSPEEGRALLLERAAAAAETVDAPLLDALRSVCAQNIYAPFDNPPFDRSPLDGIAFCSADSAGASFENPARLKVCGMVYAGSCFDGKLNAGEAVKIMTGAPMPAGADCVVGKENVREEKDKGALYALVSSPACPHDNYVFQGEDVKRGALLFPAGTVLGSAHLGVLAGMGFSAVKVFRPLRIVLFCTGDELVPPGKPLARGKIYNSNETLLAARLKELGFEAKILKTAADDALSVARLIEENAPNCDLFITTGAVSVGEKDIFHEVFSILGAERVFYRLASRPGNAALTGFYKNKLLLCLSGNPFAAILSFELLVRPVLALMSRRPDIDICYTKAVLDAPFTKSAGIRRFIRAHLADGKVSFPGGNSSGQLFSFAGCNCFADLAAEPSFFPAGAEVPVLLF